MRADKYLVTYGYFETRARAVEAIKAGNVTVNGEALKKPSQIISEGAHIKAELSHPWVSRGGIKLAHALEYWGIDVIGRTGLDVGASTGGFTDVLLFKGAARVYAVDVGRAQLHAKLRTDPKVMSMEETDARTLQKDQFDPLPDIIVCDASFISVMKVLSRPLSLVQAGTELVTLIKPQFEVGRTNIGKGGIVKSETAVNMALETVKEWVEAQGWSVRGMVLSPIKGGSGNSEYLLWGRKR